MQINSLQSQLLKGLQDHRRLKIVYHGEERIVEVHAVGTTTKGHPCFRAYQVIGGSVFGEKTGWKMFKVSDIEEVSPLDEFFVEPRAGYQRDDKGMSSILAQL